MRERTWVEISRGALRRNWAHVRARVPDPTAICAVVKADAYGHGAEACAREFCAAGAQWLAVTTVEEGARLRRGGLGCRILVAGGFAREQAGELARLELTPIVWDPEQIGWLAAAGAAMRVHLEFETGLGRLGVTAAQESAMEAALRAAPQIEVEAVLSHLAASEAADPKLAIEQRLRLTGMAHKHRWHLYNSEGALRFAALGWPDGGLLVRVGMALYGYSSQSEHAAQLTPALQWQARVVSVKDLPAGHGVGYGHTFHTTRASRIAIVAAGYADGYRRTLTPQAQVLVQGQRAPVVGAISMDLTAVDVSDVAPVKLGDAVTLLGPGMGADELAGWAATIPYEILSGIAGRVERIYTD